MEDKTNQLLTNNNSNKGPKGGMMIVGIALLFTLFAIPKLLSYRKQKESVKPMVAGTQSTITNRPIDEAPTDVVNIEISVEAGSFYFKPNLIRAKKGEKIKLTLNSVSMMHDFVVDELGVRVPVTKSGETATIEFTPDKVGEFEFYCSVGQHRQKGQVGKLIVTD